jgi:tricarballylate dehydrogenase
VVVGFGNAAQAAAYAAFEAGAKVIVLEKAPESKRGGNTWFSHGARLRHVHNGLSDLKPLLPHVPDSEWAKIHVIPYTADDYYSDLMRVTRGRSLPEMAEMLISESYPTVKWMQESGIEFEILYEAAVPEADGFHWPHGSSFINSKDGGAGLVQMWHRILNSNGIEIRFHTAAVHLIPDDSGAVTGVVYQDPRGLGEIRCKSVVLASGGFQANPAMRAQYLGAGWDLAKVRGSKYDTGDGIVMAVDVGAQVIGNWGAAHATPIDADTSDYEAGFLDPETRRYRSHRHGWSLGVMINTDGKRFLDEGEDFLHYAYAKTGAEILKQPGNIAYQIFDSKVTDQLARLRYDGGKPVTADTIRELAEKLEINVDAAVQTVEAYNAAVQDTHPYNQLIRDGRSTKGITPPKSNWAQRIDTPPYAAYAVTGGLTFTFGGLKITPRCEVVNKLDRPIKGLYAAGEVTGGFFYHNYPGGSGLIRGAVTGRNAGRNAAG